METIVSVRCVNEYFQDTSKSVGLLLNKHTELYRIYSGAEGIFMNHTEYLDAVIDDKIDYDDSKYMVYTIDKEILEVNKVKKNMRYISLNDYENMIYNSALNVVHEFAKTSNNKDVYAIFLVIDTEGSNNGLTFCTLDSYRQRIEEAYYNLDEDDERTIYGVKYNEGDALYRYYNKEFNNGNLEEISGAYYAISCDHPITDVTTNIAFDKSLFESRLVTVGLKVVEGLKSDLENIDKTEDFIISVCLHDIAETTIKKLLKYSNDLKLLRTKFLEFSERD